MRNRFKFAAAAAVAMMGLSQGTAEASSHREAPFITRMPKVDNTDFYMFRSYEADRKDDFVTIIANYSPLQGAYGGPNFFSMDPDALYEIHIDNNGDASEDLTFQFRFNNALADTTGNTGLTLDIGAADGGIKKNSVPLYNIGELSSGTGGDAARNVRESYTVKLIKGDRRTGTASDISHTAGPGTPGNTFVKPADNIGVKTFNTQNYAAYSRAHIYDVDIPGCAAVGAKKPRVFVGQRKEGFAVLLGNIFDLVNGPLDATGLLEPNGGNVPNPIGGFNVTSIAIELPMACVKGAANNIVGAWATASVRQARVINPEATFTKPSREGGPWVQVSRLGSPLVNEVVIGLKDKDKFNGSHPKDDLKNFADYVTHPTLPALIEVLFGSANAPAPKFFPRTDLVAAFVTGVDGVNKTAGAGEMLRLNMSFAPAAKGAQGFKPGNANLGAAGCFEAGATANDPKKLNTGLASCDPNGFPNGRRPGDDVVDIALRVSMGYLLSANAAPAGNVPLGDLVPQNDGQFDDTFPYLQTPNSAD